MYNHGSYGGGVAESIGSSNNDQLTKEERLFLDDLDQLFTTADDNTRRPMVEKMARDSSGHLTYKCTVCGIICTGESTMKDHLYSGLHKSLQLMKNKGLVEENYSKEECEARLKLYRSIPCNLQESLDNCIEEPLIGVEYIVEVSNGADQISDCYCALCLKWIQYKNLLPHLIALSHNFAYIQRHYPKAYFLYLEQVNFDSQHDSKTKLVKKIAKCIESTYGRQKPMRIFAPEFASNRKTICQWIHGSHHYNDSSGRTFEDVTEEFIAKLKKSGYDKNEDKEEENRSATLPTSTKDIEYKLTLEGKQNKVMELIKKAETKAKETFLYHEKNPEQHPLYPEEWKKFWNKRYNELKTEGKNTDTHDYKSEWIIFWEVRSKELYKEELRLAKKDIYRKMCLSPPNELCDPSKDNVRLNKEKRIPPEKLTSCDKSDLRFIINKCKFEKRKSAESHKSSKRRKSTEKERLRKSSDRSRRTEKSRSSNKKYTDERRHRDRSPDRGKTTKRKRSSERRKSPGRSHHRDSHRKSMDRHRATPTKRLRSGSRSASRGPLSSDKLITINSSPGSSDNESLVLQTHDVKNKTTEKDNEHKKIDIYSWNPQSDESLDSLCDVKSPVRSPAAAKRTSSSSTNNTSVCSSIHVLPLLRLLVALEDHLGSLGPKVVDLLTEALKMEKEKANSSKQLLFRDSCLTLLETINEKLKGASQAGLISDSAASAVGTAIVRTTALLEEADRLAAACKNPVKTDEKQADEIKEVTEEKKPMESCTEASAQDMELDTDNESTEPEEAVMPHPMGDLSDVDLVMLLYNFVKLNDEEQDGLIGYLKILETQDPRRVNRLRHHPLPAPTKPAPLKGVRSKSYNHNVEEVSQSVTQNPTRQDLKKSPINVTNLLATVRASVEPSPTNPPSQMSNVPVMPPNFENSNFALQNQSPNWNPTQSTPLKRQFHFENHSSIPSKIPVGMVCPVEQQPVSNNFPENFVMGCPGKQQPVSNNFPENFVMGCPGKQQPVSNNFSENLGMAYTGEQQPLNNCPENFIMGCPGGQPGQPPVSNNFPENFGMPYMGVQQPVNNFPENLLIGCPGEQQPVSNIFSQNFGMPYIGEQIPDNNCPENFGMGCPGGQQPVFNNCPENWVPNSQPPYQESNANNYFPPNTGPWNQNMNFFGSGNHWEPHPGNMPNGPNMVPNNDCWGPRQQNNINLITFGKINQGRGKNLGKKKWGK